MTHPWSETNKAKLFLTLVQEQAVTVSLLETNLFLGCAVKRQGFCILQATN